MIKPISGMSYVGKLSGFMNGTDYFDTLFQKCYKRRADKIDIDIKYFRVDEVTKEELKYLKDNYQNLKELLFKKVKDFVIIDDDYACGDIEPSIDDNGYMSIDMSEFDEDCSGYDDLRFILDINFNKPIGKVEINK